ncbi:lipase [Actinomycetospora sp. NBRC 106378]|uniref:alpha/beta hydrolase family protein n=1 Tax=Actinomycetospora sp. NBRC 106378 TaxID=3032208 RepID=UPI002554CC22|nr:lipase [Actinomycetospora sp. NBRC 106378]
MISTLPRLVRRMRVAAATTLVVGLLTSACASTAAPPPAPTESCRPTDRGRLLSVAPTDRLSPAQVATALASARLAAPAERGVDGYRVLYCTVSPQQRPSTASGLLALPHGLQGALPLVVYEHSTVTEKQNVPSDRPTGDGLLAPPFFATAGFAVIAPDYLGLGASNGPHPFMDAPSEASATRDLLPAAEQAATHLGVHLSHDVLLTGHSQGGSAVMAVGQTLQREGGPWRMRALAPMAGPYDLAATELPAILDSRAVDPHRASAYLAYLLIAWNELHPFAPNLGEVFTPPFADTVDALFDGTHGFGDIAAALPPPQQLFQPSVQELITHPSGSFAAALAASEVCRWAPRVPTRLYAGQADRDVVFANSDACRAQINAAGGHATVIDLGSVDHVGTAILALPAIRHWFLALSDH